MLTLGVRCEYDHADKAACSFDAEDRSCRWLPIDNPLGNSWSWGHHGKGAILNAAVRRHDDLRPNVGSRSTQSALAWTMRFRLDIDEAGKISFQMSPWTPLDSARPWRTGHRYTSTMGLGIVMDVVLFECCAWRVKLTTGISFGVMANNINGNFMYFWGKWDRPQN